MVKLTIKLRTAIEPLVFAVHAVMTVERERIDSVCGTCQFYNKTAHDIMVGKWITQSPHVMQLVYDDGYEVEGKFIVQSIVGNVVALVRYYEKG